MSIIKVFFQDGKVLIIPIVLVLTLLCCKRCKNDNQIIENTELDLKSEIHVGMDYKSFVLISKLTKWAPTSISSIRLDYDTIRTRLDTIVGEVNSSSYVYYSVIKNDTEWLVVNFRMYNEIELLKKYSFSQKGISYNNMDTVLGVYNDQ